MPNFLKSKLFWAAAIPAALVGFYALLGFKLAPKIARDQAQAFVRQHYQRELAVGEIAINPFCLQAEVRDLALPDADGRPMLGFGRLFVDFEIASVWNRAFTFKDVSIEAPLIRAVVRPDGSLNLADLALPEEERLLEHHGQGIVPPRWSNRPPTLAGPGRRTSGRGVPGWPVCATAPTGRKSGG